jgi:hypothetical protein
MTRLQTRGYMSFCPSTIDHMPGFWYYGRLMTWRYRPMETMTLKQAAEQLLPFLEDAYDRSDGEGESWQSQEFADAIEALRHALSQESSHEETISRKEAQDETDHGA